MKKTMKKSKSKKKQAMRRTTMKDRRPREPNCPPPSIFAGMTIEFVPGSFVPSRQIFDGKSMYSACDPIDFNYMWDRFFFIYKIYE
jgi:hypothetical protein